MWQRALQNWNFFRIIRLLLGILITVQSIQFKEYGFILVGLLFTGLAVFNLGCAGGACATPSIKQPKSSTNTPTEIEYEEVVSK